MTIIIDLACGVILMRWACEEEKKNQYFDVKMSTV